MTINTVTEDFAYFKARAGCKLNYIPHDCTEWSYSRPRRPVDEPCLPVDGAFARLCLHASLRAQPLTRTLVCHVVIGCQLRASRRRCAA